MSELDITTLGLFSTPVWHIYLDDDKTDRIKLIEESYRLRKENPRGWHYHLHGGWHSQQNLHKNKIFSKLNNLIFNIIKNTIIPKHYATNNIPIHINQTDINPAWVVINGKHDRNQLHTHTGTWLTGVFYIRIPSAMPGGKLVLQDTNPVRKHESWEYKSTEGMKFNIEPEEGILVLFPSWVPHLVTPNHGEDDRICYSFTVNYSKQKQYKTGTMEIDNGK